jgi:4,5-DOPA dioxygenase extradiol
LRPLRDAGVLVIGSGGATHNLSLYMRAGDRAEDAAPLEWVEAFNEWLVGAIEAGRIDDLLQWRQRAPYAAPNHPTPEHFLPLFAVLGAAGEGEPGRRIHTSYDRGLLSLDSYAFGWAAAAAGAGGGGVH